MDEGPVSPPHCLRPTGRTARGWPVQPARPGSAREARETGPEGGQDHRIRARSRGPKRATSAGNEVAEPTPTLQAQRFTVGWVLEQDALLERLATTLRAVPSFRPRFILILAKLTH